MQTKLIIALLVSLVLVTFLVTIEIDEKTNLTLSNEPYITYLAPEISSSGNQVLESGSYEVRWESQNLENIVVSLIDSEMSSGDSVLVSHTSGPIDASLGKYTLYIPSLTGSGVKRYHFLLGGIRNGQIYAAESPSFLVVTD